MNVINIAVTYGWEYRYAMRKDIPEIREIFDQAFPGRNMDDDDFLGIMDCEVCIDMKTSRIIGFTKFYKPERGGVEIRLVAVRDGFRRQGVGTGLLRVIREQTGKNLRFSIQPHGVYVGGESFSYDTPAGRKLAEKCGVEVVSDEL